MIRISKLTDYGVVIMAFMAHNPLHLFQASEIARSTSIAKPTVAQLLQKLTKNKLLISERGTHGGYHLATSPDKITIADLVQALEGPIAITECNLGHEYCHSATLCTVKAPWQRINTAIHSALQSITLSDLSQTTFPKTQLEVSDLTERNSLGVQFEVVNLHQPHSLSIQHEV